MRKWAIATFIFGIIGVLQLLLVPMIKMEYSDYFGPDFEGIVYVYFNGRVKIISIVEGVRDVFTTGSLFWDDMLGLTYPGYIIALNIIGIVLFLLAALFKIIYHDKEDRRISGGIMLTGSICGLLGAIFYSDFGNDLIRVIVEPVPRYFIGYYTNIGFFSGCIIISIIFLVFGFIKPFSDEKDLWENPDKIKNLMD